MMLKILLLLLPLATLVTASGSDLPDDQVEEVLALYRKHCASSYGQSSSLGHNVNIVCKEGREDHEPPRKQVIRIPPPPPPKKNILFVEAPAYKVKHEITVVGNAENAQRTKIYVLPSKNSHNFNIQNNVGGVQAQKPQVFFLKSGGSDNSMVETPVTKPPPVYGLPDHKPGNLGSQYEVVPADTDTNSQNDYQRKQVNTPQEQQQQVFMTANMDMDPQDYALSSDQSQVQVPQVPQEPEEPQQQQHNEPQVLVQPLQGLMNLASYGNGRIIFPSESIQHQQYQFSPFQFQTPQVPQEAVEFMSNGNLMMGEPLQEYVMSTEAPTTTTETPVTESPPTNVLSNLPKSLFKRKLVSSQSSKIIFPDEKVKAKGKNISYNDYYNYMGGSSGEVEIPKKNFEYLKLQESKKEEREEQVKPITITPAPTINTQEVRNSYDSSESLNSFFEENNDMDPFHLRLLMALASSKAQRELKHMNHPTVPPQQQQQSFVSHFEPEVSNSNNNNNNNNQKVFSRRSSPMSRPAFEIIPANFVSYSYTKSKIEDYNGQRR